MLKSFQAAEIVAKYQKQLVHNFQVDEQLQGQKAQDLQSQIQPLGQAESLNICLTAVTAALDFHSPTFLKNCQRQCLVVFPGLPWRRFGQQKISSLNSLALEI